MKMGFNSNAAALQRRDEAQRDLRREGDALNVAALPSFGFGHRSILWWATQGLIAIEGTVFAMAIVAYLYLRSLADVWPPLEQPPAWRWGVSITLGLFLSLWPAVRAKRAAEQLDRRGAQTWLVASSGASLTILALRALEFGTLNCRWDGSAYGSIVWMVLGLHTVHLLTDAWDTLVLTALSFTDRFEAKRFVDVSENALYWYFVVWSWPPLFALLYLAPRELR